MIRQGLGTTHPLPFLAENLINITSEKRVADEGDRLYKDKNGQK